MNLMLLNNVLDLDPSKKIVEVTDKLQYGGMMLLLGMLTVFSVLAIIWLSLLIFKIVFHDLPSKKKASPIQASAPVAQDESAAISNDEEIVAVIAAAIAMAESDSNGIKFKVVSFRRI